ncbi:alpha-D-ribose 1-methylphosphonate 5-triphosphate diphosphatase [Telmatospirillum sp. J64-1]|uniref:alpha-D-ribose 1-methylphosphonate 5-triphosphate diphosphatase n=1 Tax=Telmatospirillum sp. J64-1 TaxID=2502183 RepID=UPI00115D52F9|nr:alpha-D-ribose 1-methylphosphonate 5-triphosphate diphosphatase [Telmatospirillum sp. J64-1]
MLHIRGGEVLLADGSLSRTDLLIENGAIQAIGPEAAREGAETWDASGLLVLPGIIDLHGDAFERQVMPRPGVTFPLELALLDTDRQLVANGITTAYHGLTYSWEPGLRGPEAAREFLAAMTALDGRLACDTKVHLRFETYNLDAADEVVEWLRSGVVRLLAFNDHVPLIEEKMARPGGINKYAERAGMSAEEFRLLVQRVRAREAEVPVVVGRLAAEALAKGVVMASHDDETPAMRRWYHDLGCHICEFPINRETAEFSRDLGDPIIMGAPNILRGGSHAGRLSAMEMVTEGTCDVLTSDYYYPSLLQAAFTIVRQGVLDLGAAWALVSANPAQAAGLADRGRIQPGARADLVLVQAGQGFPQAVATLVAGKPVFTSGQAPLRPQAGLLPKEGSESGTRPAPASLNY